MRWILLLTLVVLQNASFAQAYNPEKVNKKAINFYNQALLLADEGKFKDGIALLDKAISLDGKFVDGYLSRAGMYGELKDYQHAIEDYEKSFALDLEYSQDYKLPYAINVGGTGDFDKALKAVNEFLANPKLNEPSKRAGLYRKKCFEFAVNFAKEHPDAYLFEPKNLGEGVNTPVSEYYPTLTIDGNTLIYTRRVRNVNEDFYVTQRVNNQWTPSISIPGDINSNFNEGAQNISQDGEWLLFTGCNFKDGFGSCDLYISFLNKQGQWGKPVNLGQNINTEFWESAPSLSPDKKEIYFASRSPEGYGGSDLWVTRRRSDGRWSIPENLGPSINTVGDESTPFIHPDNQTLYFTSNGHIGYGGDDLLLARKKSDGTWNKPENLGYPINTIENEGSLVISSDGQTSYYASDRSDSKGGLDLYTFDMRESMRPKKTTWVTGKVYDKKTGAGIPSLVEVIPLDKSVPATSIQTDEEGKYLATLPVGSDYAFNVNRKGYLFYSGNFPLKNPGKDTTYKIDIPLQPIETNASIVLKNIFFASNSYVLETASTVELDKLVQLLNDNPTVKVLISGHTDNVGKPADNLTLSNNRAKSVVEYLTSKSISATRLRYQGYGETKPVGSNSTEEGRSQNRRTECTVTGF